MTWSRAEPQSPHDLLTDDTQNSLIVLGFALCCRWLPLTLLLLSSLIVIVVLVLLAAG
jgi:hypothetical protein